MKMFKKAVALATVLALFASSAEAAEPCKANTGGCGYYESCRAPMIGPCLALGTIALVAIIAVALTNNSHSGHGHCHR